MLQVSSIYFFIYIERINLQQNPSKIRKVNQGMNVDISTNDKNEYMFSFTIKGVHHRIPLLSIIYIESSKRKCILHTLHNDNKPSNSNLSFDGTTPSDNELSFYGKLNEVSELLSGYGFVRCHQSYLISLQHVSKYHDGFLYAHGNSIPVSERYRSRIINFFDNNASMYISNPLSTRQRHLIGVLICISGEYKGSIVRIYPNIDYELGRDGKVCEIVINLPYISRRHCTLTYHENSTYTITDHSHNGTYLIQDNSRPKKLIADKIEVLPTGSVICFGDTGLQYRLL